tara:strand:- start:39 stop:299 length:261 start_codon:yes stop_codon:yes gene_type:complete
MNSDSDSDHRQFAVGEMSLVDANAKTGWEEMKDSNAFVKLSKKQIKGERTTWGKAVSTIDSPGERASLDEDENTRDEIPRNGYIHL